MALYDSVLNQMEDSLSCPVCWEVYEDPLLLQCQHSICKRCCMRLNKDARIPCPKCRNITNEKDLVNNLVLKNLACVYQETQKTKNMKNPARKYLCELCEFNGSLYYCYDCKRSLCEGCKRRNIKSSACQETEIKSLQDIGEEYIKEFETKCNMLSSRQKAITCKMDKTLVSAKNHMNAVLEDFRKQKTQMIAAIQGHFHKQETKARLQYERYAANTYGKACSGRDALDLNIKEVQDSMDQSIPAVVNQENSLGALVKKKIQKSRELQLPMFTVQKSKNMVAIVSGKMTTYLPELAFVNAISFLHRLEDCILKVEKTFELYDQCHMVLAIDGFFVCLMRTSIQIRNSLTGELTHMSTADLGDVGGADFAQTGALFIAAREKGLLRCWLKPPSKTNITKVATGFYHSVKIMDSKMVTLREDNRSNVFLEIFTVGSTTSTVQTTKLHIPRRQPYNRITLVGSSLQEIFICISMTSQIYEINSLDGNIIRSFANKGTKLNAPRLCSYDSSHGLVLVADVDNSRLKVLNVNTGGWTMVDTDQLLVRPVSATIDKDQRMFCVGQNPARLYLCGLQPITDVPDNASNTSLFSGNSGSLSDDTTSFA